MFVQKSIKVKMAKTDEIKEAFNWGLGNWAKTFNQNQIFQDETNS